MSNLEPSESDQDLTRILASSCWQECIEGLTYAQCGKWIIDLFCADHYVRNMSIKKVLMAHLKLEVNTLLHE